MGFIEDVQAYLKAQAEPQRPPPALPPGFDMEKRRAVMWEALEDIGGPAQRTEHEVWSTPGYLQRFVSVLVDEARESVGMKWSAARLARVTDLALVAEIHGREVTANEAGSAVLALELSRIGTVAKRAADTLVVAGIEAWCRAVRAVDADDHPTAIGRALCSLTGREAVRLALELEAALSTGKEDEYRVARPVLAALLSAPIVWRHGDGGERPRRSVERLVLYGVAETDWAPSLETLYITASPDAIDLLRSILDPAPNPYRALVQALLDAERGKLTTAITGIQTNAGSDLAYVRMVVHELRNLTLPLTHVHKRLWAELERPEGPDPERLTDLRTRLERTTDRILEFTSGSERLAEAVSIGSFSLREVAEEALAATEPDRNGRIRVLLDGLGDASIEGVRERWVLLFVNLFRNAAQVRAGPGNVWVVSEWIPGGPLRLYVEDDGPGVPEELRESIFGMGMSTRGGTGMGLFDAKNTVLQSGGSVRCEASPRGGARFHIQVPARRRA